jgi:hypothetical protein
MLPISCHADQSITQDLACAAVCDLGLFGTSPHLGAVHQSLAPASAGVPFERVRALPATVHGGRFSPCNAQFRVPIDSDEADAALSAHSFFAVAHDAANSRYVVIGLKAELHNRAFTQFLFLLPDLVPCYRTILQFFLVAANASEGKICAKQNDALESSTHHCKTIRIFRFSSPPRGRTRLCDRDGNHHRHSCLQPRRDGLSIARQSCRRRARSNACGAAPRARIAAHGCRRKTLVESAASIFKNPKNENCIKM